MTLKRVTALILVLLTVFLIGCSTNLLQEIHESEKTSEKPIVINITNKQAKKLIKKNSSLIILDVRTKTEYDTGHLKNAKLIPISELEERLDELDKNSPILVYCRRGNRSATASKILMRNEFKKIYNLKNGIENWDGEIITD